MGVFHVFKFIQVVPNHAKHLISSDIEGNSNIHAILWLAFSWYSSEISTKPGKYVGAKFPVFVIWPYVF